MTVAEGDVLAAQTMSIRALQAFYAKAIDEAKAEGVLLSLHLKATMMKVSDPIMFGHAVRAYYRDVFDKHAATFESLGVSPDNGIGDVYTKIKSLPAEQRAAIEADLQAVYATRPPLAMVDSSKGITNLHVPSDVIIDASMPAAIRASGQMWGPDGKLHDTKAMIPDRCYASVYQVVIDDCKAHGAFDVPTMGTVSNVGSDGAEGRGVRVARQDVRDSRRRARARHRRHGTDRLRASRRGRRHLAHVDNEGRGDQGLGEAGGEPRPRDRPCRDLLARRAARLRPQCHRHGARAT